MNAHFRGRFARSCLLLLLAVHLGACTTTSHVVLRTTPDLSHVTGMTTWSGQEISFEPRGARLAGDTLYAMSGAGPVVIAADSVRRVWVTEPAPGKTLGLIALVVGTVIVWAAMDNWNSKFGCAHPTSSGC